MLLRRWQDVVDDRADVIGVVEGAGVVVMGNPTSKQRKRLGAKA